MKAHLMFRDRDFEIQKDLAFGREDLTKDLELEYILSQTAGKDEMIYSSVKEALLNPLLSLEEILYRQDNMRDVLENGQVIRELYDVTIETEKKRKGTWRWFSTRYLSFTFTGAVELLDIYLEMLMKLRLIADEHKNHFHSEGYSTLFDLFQHELDDSYFEEAKLLIDNLKHSEGTFISSTLGSYLQGVKYVLRRREKKGAWRKWFFAPSFTISQRDETGARDLEARRERAINEATNSLAQATDHLESFFTMLRRELAFYVGCVNLAERIQELQMPLVIPKISPFENHHRSWKNLYDLSLLLFKGGEVIGNDLHAQDCQLYLITGANQGGKSTYLRSIGQAQMMAQAGMFVAAQQYASPLRKNVFTHFKKEEDRSLSSGKLDEELSRMNEMTKHLVRGDLMLFNESFAATNEREGSEICTQITKALIEGGIEVFSVTHLYTYASMFVGRSGVHFLRAQRLEDGVRTFRIEEGAPLVTAFGDDLYQEIFRDFVLENSRSIN